MNSKDVNCGKFTTKRIDSLQALRAMAFLGIFLTHAQFIFDWAGLGVSIFFVMSSFLLEKKHIDISLDCSLKENLKFSIIKIKKLFPLYLITMIPFVVFSIFTMISKGITFSRVIFLLLKILLNITLLQTWFPYDAVNRSLNGVAWFLSAMLFLYFIYPLLRKITQNMKLWLFFIVCCSVLFLQILIVRPDEGRIV